MRRRDFLEATAATMATTVLPRFALGDEQEKAVRVMTVKGEIQASQLGKMLPHEHILVDFVGADQVSPERYDADEVFDVMLPYLKQAKSAGCQSLAECTPAYLGRDPQLLRQLSQASGLTLLTNTGYYGARQGMFLPEHAHESAEQLAKRWTAEWNDGIDGTGIRPGFIKIGVDAGELSSVDRKLVEAAALCHLDTGLTIAGHTGDGTAALQQVALLKKAGVSPNAWIWVHAQNERDTKLHQQVVRSGAWIEFDGVSPKSIERHVELVTQMKRAGRLDQVLLSHDAGWYSVGEPRGGMVRGFDTLFTKFLPALKQAGFSDEEIHQLTVTNPAKAFAIRVHAEWGRAESSAASTLESSSEKLPIASSHSCSAPVSRRDHQPGQQDLMLNELLDAHVRASFVAGWPDSVRMSGVPGGRECHKPLHRLCLR